MNRNSNDRVKALAKKFKICYGIPEDKSIQLIDCNMELDVVKFALNGDFISQNALAKKLQELLNIKLEKDG